MPLSPNFPTGENCYRQTFRPARAAIAKLILTDGLSLSDAAQVARNFPRGWFVENSPDGAFVAGKLDLWGAEKRVLVMPDGTPVRFPSVEVATSFLRDLGTFWPVYFAD